MHWIAGRVATWGPVLASTLSSFPPLTAQLRRCRTLCLPPPSLALSLRHQLRFFLASALFWKHLDLLHHTYILSLRFKKKNSPSSVLRFLWLFEIEGNNSRSEAPSKPSVPFPCSLLDAIERRLLILQLQSTRVLIYTVVVARGSFPHLFPHESSCLRWPRTK